MKVRLSVPSLHSDTTMQTIMFMLSFVSTAQCLDSNIIQSSREMTNSQESVLHLLSETNSQNSVRRRTSGILGMTDNGRDCSIAPAHEKCKGSKKKQRNAGKIRIQIDGRGKQKVPEMSPCVRSRDCEEGLCCALYLTGRRCQRVPAVGDVCLLRGRAKFRRRLDRCDCEQNLYCRPQPDSPRGQGLCYPHVRGQNYRITTENFRL